MTDELKPLIVEGEKVGDYNDTCYAYDIDDGEFKEVDFSAIGRCIIEKADDELNDEDSYYFVI